MCYPFCLSFWMSFKWETKQSKRNGLLMHHYTDFTASWDTGYHTLNLARTHCKLSVPFLNIKLQPSPVYRNEKDHLNSASDIHKTPQQPSPSPACSNTQLCWWEPKSVVQRQRDPGTASMVWVWIAVLSCTSQKSLGELLKLFDLQALHYKMRLSLL